ncbi:uncharacterized protein METZ01_LOCUS93473, partial [marine metagenome]
FLRVCSVSSSISPERKMPDSGSSAI